MRARVERQRRICLAGFFLLARSLDYFYFYLMCFFLPQSVYSASEEASKLWAGRTRRGRPRRSLRIVSCAASGFVATLDEWQQGSCAPTIRFDSIGSDLRNLLLPTSRAESNNQLISGSIRARSHAGSVALVAGLAATGCLPGRPAV